MLNAKFLWMFITRGTMLIVPHNQNCVDIILPLCLRTGSFRAAPCLRYLFRSRLKTSDKYGYDIEEALFGGLSLFRVGLFDAGSPKARDSNGLCPHLLKIWHTLPRSARASPYFLPRGFHRFRYLVCGLSSFKDTHEGLASYQILLDRSLRPREFELLRGDVHLNDATELRADRRRTMAALPIMTSTPNFTKMMQVYTYESRKQ